ncbi:MAG: ComEA family DNA-binding protein, partial [Planctomycetota bacterium]
VWTIPGTFVIANSLDLVGVSVALPAEGKQTASAPKKVLRSPFSSDNGERRNYLGKWLSDTTLVDTPVLEGRVDVTEAPAEVLMGIPGIDANLAQRIVEQRRSVASNPEALDSVAWLVESGVIDMAKLREIEPFLTNRSDVYTVQSIGFRDNRSPVYRCTVTIDARTIPASVLDLKVWHPWDRGFDIDSLNGITR